MRVTDVFCAVSLSGNMWSLGITDQKSRLWRPRKPLTSGPKVSNFPGVYLEGWRKHCPSMRCSAIGELSCNPVCPRTFSVSAPSRIHVLRDVGNSRVVEVLPLYDHTQQMVKQESETKPLGRGSVSSARIEQCALGGVRSGWQGSCDDSRASCVRPCHPHSVCAGF